ncbi:class I SAM-dependent methyltransferase [Nesterenkonia natronophila]|uniref:Class I SAM-dependent methyltransferase n=1 Tax=Nesterenkonia natronophila TaxID=2174932 RepID=A0A3A4FCZ7_9MICC|nr:class I SAM-dependent methyltransferase [Nesterenkonia natronophila]RJN32967.1 hypothetical protein D3250_03940 [Nesterenkonia natronophila]
MTIDAEWLAGRWEAVSSSPVQQSSANDGQRFQALLQQGRFEEAREIITSGSMEPTVAAKALSAAVHTSLGRIALLNNRESQAQSHFQTSIETLAPAWVTDNTVDMRVQEQLRQLDLPPRVPGTPYEESQRREWVGEAWLEAARGTFPKSTEILIALAEGSFLRKNYDEAIRHWQQLSAVMQGAMPQEFYNRLDKAYQAQGSFPSGTPDEEQLRGSMDKHKFLEAMHRDLDPDLYLEIGVQSGVSFRLARCQAIGVDPMPYPSLGLSKNHTLLQMTSDTFFDEEAEVWLVNSPDLVFIDGMHLFEFALRDFINVEKFSSKNTIVIMDDIFPGHPAQAERDRRTRAWTGDVWRLAHALREFRPDLQLDTLDVSPTGLLVIRNLDPDNVLLSQRYETIVEATLKTDLDLERYVERSNSIDPHKWLSESRLKM